VSRCANWPRVRSLLAVSALLVLLTTLSLSARPPQADTPSPFDPDRPLTDLERAERLRRIQPGLSPDQVRQLLGPPGRTARQVLYHRAREQWLYDAPFSARLEFEYMRGQEPHLLSVQPVAPAKP
jgi:hypothetical protein